LSGRRDAIGKTSKLEKADLKDWNFKKDEEGSCEIVDYSFTSLDATDVMKDEDADCGTDDLSVLNARVDGFAVELFWNEEVYCCGEVGCWKDSGGESRLVNAWEVRRDGIAMEMDDEEAEYHSHEQLGEEVEPPGVPEEYN